MVANLIPDSIKHEFRVDQDGKAFVSIRGAARLLGITMQTLQENLKPSFEDDRIKWSKLAQALISKEFEPDKISSFGMSDIEFAHIAHYYAHEARKKTEQAKDICLAFVAIGVRSWIQSELGWRTPREESKNDRIKELELQLAIAQQTKEANQASLDARQLDHAMLTIHGAPVVLALRGLQDQIVREETVVIEVLEPNKGSTRFLSAAETLKQIKQRTGQSPKSLTQVIKQLKALGRDDLVVAVKRPVVGEYIIPEKLDEAIGLLYQKTRQGLLGED